MATHRIYGTTHLGGQAVSRRVDVIAAADWLSSGVAAGVVGSAISDAGTGAWSVDLDNDDPVYVISPPVAPYPPLLLGPFSPVPLAP